MLSLLLSLAAVTPPDDVLVILLDDIGKDLLAVYSGPEPAYTPNIDLMAANGRVYDRAYANPLCGPSRACMVTGRYAFRTGFGTNHRQGAAYEVGTAEVCLPEMLSLSGLDASVQYFNKWHLINSDGVPDTDRHPIDSCGFERFYGHLSNLGSEPTLPGSDHYNWRSAKVTPEAIDVLVHNGYEAENYTEATWATSVCKDEMVAHLNALSLDRRAIFIWSPVAPHGPFQAPPATLVSPATAAALLPPPAEAPAGHERAYALAMIEALDSVIGEALAEISPERLSRLTVILIGDNGTSKKALHPQFDPTHAKGTVFELGVGVPLVIWGPSVGTPGTRDDSLVHIVDIPATISEMAGSTTLPGEDSVSFLPTFSEGIPGAREKVFCERFDTNGPGPEITTRALIGVRYKLIRRTIHNSGGGAEETDQLYDLALDPNEANDLLAGQLTTEQQLAFNELDLDLRTLVAPSPSTFCDGQHWALLQCPCDQGSPETGCDTARRDGGIGLKVLAQTTTPKNRATFQGIGFPVNANTPALVLRASHLDSQAPIAFGDGLLCLGGQLVRLSAGFAVGGSSTHTFGHGVMAGSGAFYYQLWFRNMPESYCDPTAAFNLSAGQVLTW